MRCTNETRRRIMGLAWDFYRADTARTFADALRRAWRWTKGVAAAGRRIVEAAKGGARVQLASPYRSPRPAVFGQHKGPGGYSGRYSAAPIGF